MNQRITKLANKANEDIGYKIPMIQAKQMHKLMQKFAQLIVRECASIVEDAVTHREPASTYVDKIKEHFGVEE